MTRSPATRDLAAALAGLRRCGLKEHTLGLAPESLSWGRGALAVVCPAPKGAGLRFWLAPLGTEKKGGGERERRPRRSKRQRWHERDLECFCVRVSLPPLSVLEGPGAPRAGDLLWRNSSPGCAAVSAAPTPPGWKEVPGIPPHRTCVGDREREEWPVPWLYPKCCNKPDIAQCRQNQTRI